QFLPPGKLTFDMLVIDEASQVAPDDALGAVARAKQLIVVGDHKQLPPTNFFKMVNAGGDDGNEEDEEITNVDRPSDYESILTLARSRGMAERMLAWHYRSKHPSLIALSNDQCYAGKLLPPPKPIRSDGRLWFDAFKPKDERLFVKNLEAIPGDERDVVFISVGLYRVPEIVTLGRLPGEGESDSRWRTKEVRHVCSDTLTPGF